MKKLTKKQQAERDARIERELVAWEARVERYHDKEFAATVRWFDALSGEGMVQLEDGSSWYLNFSAIQGIDKNNYRWPAEKDLPRLKSIEGMSCTVRLYAWGGMVKSCALKVG
jgi:hypothetical protein